MVVLFQSIHCFRDHAPLFAEVSRICKHEARVLVATTLPAQFRSLLYCGLCRDTLSRELARHPDIPAITNGLGVYGFKLIEAYEFGHRRSFHHVSKIVEFIAKRPFSVYEAYAETVFAKGLQRLKQKLELLYGDARVSIYLDALTFLCFARKEATRRRS
jgi:hypothetical protein